MGYEGTEAEAEAAEARAVAEEAESELTFADDLIAANNFKTFLIGRGIEVPKDILTGLGVFSHRYEENIEHFRKCLAITYASRQQTNRIRAFFAGRAPS